MTVHEKWKANFRSKMQRDHLRRYGTICERWRVDAVMRSIDAADEGGDQEQMERAIMWFGFIDAEMDGDFPFPLWVWQSWAFHEWAPHNID